MSGDFIRVEPKDLDTINVVDAMVLIGQRTDTNAIGNFTKTALETGFGIPAINASINDINNKLNDPIVVDWTNLTGVVWTAGTAPSDLLLGQYNLTQIGKLVTVNLILSYDTLGSGVTGVTIPWQDGWPEANKPAAIDAAEEVFGAGYNPIGNTGDLSPTSASAAAYFLRRNSTNTGDEYFATFSSSNRSSIQGSFTYQAL